ncbi:MAG: hypothetical protein WCF84_03405 [Anaerolineae bacterium]
MALSSAPLCPYLGSWQDPSTAFFYPTSGNACYTDTEGETIDKETQAALCLSANHPQCPRFRARSQSKPPA